MIGEFASKWAELFNGGMYNMPTARQVMSGLLLFMELQADRLTAPHKKERVPHIKNTLRWVFQNIQNMIAFTDMDHKFEWYTNSEYSCGNPKSKACVLCLWFWSIEPPLYCHLNKASRQMDAYLLPMLGPWARALMTILNGAEENRSDKLTPGRDLLHLGLGSMGGSFVVFRGVTLEAK